MQTIPVPSSVAEALAMLRAGMSYLAAIDPEPAFEDRQVRVETTFAGAGVITGDVTHLADGGTTSVDGCSLYCFFHHHVAIHQWGWTVALHPDGTTTARSPDGTKVLHSHGPPARAG